MWALFKKSQIKLRQDMESSTEWHGIRCGNAEGLSSENRSVILDGILPSKFCR